MGALLRFLVNSDALERRGNWGVCFGVEDSLPFAWRIELSSCWEICFEGGVVCSLWRA